MLCRMHVVESLICNVLSRKLYDVTSSDFIYLAITVISLLELSVLHLSGKLQQQLGISTFAIQNPLVFLLLEVPNSAVVLVSTWWSISDYIT